MVNTSSSSRKRQRQNSSNNEDDSEQEYQVEAILDKRIRGRKTQYLLKWKGYSHADNTVRFLNMFCYDNIHVRKSFFQRDIYFFSSRSFLVKHRRIFIVKEVAY